METFCGLQQHQSPSFISVRLSGTLLSLFQLPNDPELTCRTLRQKAPRVCGCVWNIWTDVKLLPLFVVYFSDASELLFPIHIFFSISRGTIHVLWAMVQPSGYSTCGYHGWSLLITMFYFCNGEALSGEPQPESIYYFPSSWPKAKPRTLLRLFIWVFCISFPRLSRFCSVSTICFLGYFIKILVVILFIDGILFWGLFGPVSDRDWLYRNSFILTIYRFEEIYPRSFYLV